MFNKLIAVGLLLCSNLVWAEVEVSDVWIREAPPTATVMAAYMQLKNTGAQPIALNAANCEQYQNVELHSTVMENGVARMVPMDKMEIPAGETLSLQPGAQHIMLIGVLKRPVVGDKVKLTLKFSDDSRQDVLAEVRKVEGTMPMEHHHH